MTEFMLHLRRPCAVLASCLFLVLAAPARADQAYLSELEDLPLAPGLVEHPGGVLFDSPGGRIIDATADGDTTVAAVTGFYSQTLPALGWSRQADGSYRRDTERLRITVDGSRRPLTVHFSVEPR